MVREARFAFDDHRHPDDNPREHFTEEDERLLDGFLPPPRPSTDRKLAGRRVPRTPARHLADGDWLDPQKKRRKRGKDS